MKLKGKRRIISLTALLLTIAVVSGNSMNVRAAGCFKTDNDEIVIAIDPGHGGKQEGAMFEYDGEMVLEKDINLDIALALENELKEYKHVRIVMIREDDSTVDQQTRADIAYDEHADYYISVHCNARGENDDGDPSGCMMIIPYGSYQRGDAVCPNINGITKRIAETVIKGLTSLGLDVSGDFEEMNTAGIVRRPYSPDGWATDTKYYPDDTVADYYSQMRFTMEYGIPAVLIEHAYMSNVADYRNYLEKKETREMLGKKDAEAIAEALHLAK